jgi:hypothetical protein
LPIETEQADADEVVDLVSPVERDLVDRVVVGLVVVGRVVVG